MSRSRHLDEANLPDEARSMADRAANYEFSVDLTSLACGHLALYFRSLGPVDMFSAYARLLVSRSPTPEVETLLADTLVIEKCWRAVDVLPDDHILRRDAPHVTAAVDAMDSGSWRDAVARLHPVGRRSPYAPWKLFAKAMTAFGEGRDDDLGRLLALLPADFPMIRTVDGLRHFVTSDGDGGGPAIQKLLGGSVPVTDTLIESFRDSLAGKAPLRGMATTITRLADVILPDDPTLAKIAFLEIAASGMAHTFDTYLEARTLTRRLLGAARAEGVYARLVVLAQKIACEWDPGAVVDMFRTMAVEWPDPEDQALVRGCVLDTLARNLAGVTREAPWLGFDWFGQFDYVEDPSLIQELTGKPVEEPRDSLVALMEASLAADPANRDGYIFLCQRQKHERSRNVVRDTLKKMARQFPADPFPWLELAKDCYQTNAYRQAQEALTQAARRAPHDDRFLDLETIGLLKSADSNRQSGRYAKAAGDIRQAEAINRPALSEVVLAKRFLLDLATFGTDRADIFRKHLEPLNARQRGQVAVLAALEVTMLAHGPVASSLTESLADRSFIALLPGSDTLAEGSIIDLVAMLPSDFGILYPDRNRFRIADGLWPGLLGKLEGDLFLEALGGLAAARSWTRVRTEVARRLDADDRSAEHQVLLLYLSVARYEDGIDDDMSHFSRSIETLDERQVAHLRSAAQRLSVHTDEPMRTALGSFEFDSLDDFGPFGGDGHAGPRRIDFAFDDDQTDAATNAWDSRIGRLPNNLSDLDEDSTRYDTSVLRDTIDHIPDVQTLTDGIVYLEIKTLRHGRGSGSPASTRTWLVALERVMEQLGLLGTPPDRLRALVAQARLKPTVAHFLDSLADDVICCNLGDELTNDIRSVVLSPRRRTVRC